MLNSTLVVEVYPLQRHSSAFCTGEIGWRTINHRGNSKSLTETLTVANSRTSYCVFAIRVERTTIKLTPVSQLVSIEFRYIQTDVLEKSRKKGRHIVISFQTRIEFLSKPYMGRKIKSILIRCEVDRIYWNCFVNHSFDVYKYYIYCMRLLKFDNFIDFKHVSSK